MALLLKRKAAMRLLIAEDDRALGLFLSRGLEADGHRVRLAYDGAAAVEAFRQDSPDLTILDLNMPVKDGEQVLEEVRALDSELPVLVLTPASTSTTTLAAAAPVTTGVSGILPADATTTPSASNSTLTASTPVAGTTAYTFAPTGTVAAGTSLTITDGVNTCTVTPSSPNESLAAFASDITTALGNAVPGAITATATGTDGVPGTNTPGTLTIVGAGVSVTPASSSLKQDVAETTTNYDLVSSNGAVAQVGASNGVPPTNLSIKLGNGAAVSAPAFASGMSLAAYATALQNAVGAPAVSGVTIQANAVTGLLSITGPANMAIAGNLVQDFSGKSTSYSFSATGTVDAATL
jgi:CheY-like chemotaxis protein